MFERSLVSRILKCAVECAFKCGRFVARYHNSDLGSSFIEKKDHDIKLQLDILAQKRAVSIIRKYFPSHSILGEEDWYMDDRINFAKLDKGFCWLVDPIDATVNYWHGLKYWCVSIACIFNGRIIAGCVYAPEMDELYSASIYSCSKLNGRCITVSDVSIISEALITTGVIPEKSTSDVKFNINRIADTVSRVRVLGSAALDICQVAAGRAEAYFESNIFPWDIAAGALIVCKAGGRVVFGSMNSEGRMACLAVNKALYKDMFGLFKKYIKFDKKLNPLKVTV